MKTRSRNIKQIEIIQGNQFIKTSKHYLTDIINHHNHKIKIFQNWDAIEWYKFQHKKE
jgi:hypothetical protein